MTQDYDPAKTCFIIMPYGSEEDPGTLKELNGAHHIFKKAVERAGLSPRRSDESTQAGSIHHEMLQHIFYDAAAIVDITLLNPNVFYELGVRHALRQNVTVLVRKIGTKSPFNIFGMRLIEYGLDVQAADEATEKIATALRNGLDRPRNDSRVYDVFPTLGAKLA